ncbi:MAG: ABC transporter ATP-binding protein [Planctomyces sp.]|nr:ABC transporter ATP-binding protein [Planctomyces sp.]
MQPPENQGIRIKGVTHRFRADERLIVEAISLDVREGEFVSIVGPSGCGKSTLLRMVAGLLKPSEGEIVVGCGSERSPAGARIGFVFQQAALLPWRTAWQNLVLPFELGPTDVRQGIPSESQIFEVIRRVGLRREDVHKRPRELSGGMRMRLSLARAILQNPAILLLDEPLAAVDDILRVQLQEDLAGLHFERRLTSMLVTHHLHEAIFLSDRVIVLSGSPGRQLGELRVDEPHPRRSEFRRSEAFFRLTNELSSILQDGGAER